MEPWFPRDGWTPACPYESVNLLIVLLCLHALLLLYQLICLYLNKWIFFFVLFFQFSSPSHCVGLNEQLCGAYLLAQLNHGKIGCFSGPTCFPPSQNLLAIQGQLCRKNDKVSCNVEHIILLRDNNYNFTEISGTHHPTGHQYIAATMQNIKRIVWCAVSRVPLFSLQMRHLHVYGSH